MSELDPSDKVMLLMSYFETKLMRFADLNTGLLKYATTFSFILREDLKVEGLTKTVLDDLSKYLIERKTVRKWPGTELLMGQAELFLYHFNFETAFILQNTENYIYGWVHPNLPEDIVFYKDDRPIFISITHEKDAYFELNQQDIDFFKKTDFRFL